MAKKKPKIKFKELQDSENVAELLSDEQLKEIGRQVVDSYEKDKGSRAEWEKRTRSALDLALQVMETKSYPWPNAANVKFPLLTIAALQFSARVYPALIQAPDLVKYRIMGTDPQGTKASRALRVSRYISYQLLEENERWEEEQDRLFIALPILGTVFKKTYYNTLEDKVDSCLVLPHDLVVHYYTKDLARSRCTEVFELYPREIRERQLRGLYIDKELVEQVERPGPNVEHESSEREGLRPADGDDETPRVILEQHGFYDLDGDGYAEPYCITVDKETCLPLRIYNRFRKVISEQSLKIQKLQQQNFLLAQTLPPPEAVQQLQQQGRVEEVQAIIQRMKEVQQIVEQNHQKIEALGAEDPDIIRIEPKVYYTKYSFIPAPDGGYYDLGFGQLLGPLNHSVNTLINQLLDAGTMQVGSNGFIAKGARIVGGSQRFEPFEWKRVNVAGQTLKESIVPLPINEPSAVLFNLLGMLVNYAERVSSVTDVMSGENPGQNTPAFNMKAMLDQGMQVFNGVFKRIYRSFRSEIRKVYVLNSEYLDPEKYVEAQDGDFRVLQTDFGGDPKDIIPAADPNAFSNMEKMTKAQFLASRLMQAPGYNPVTVEKRLLEAMDIPDVDEVYPLTPDGQLAIPPPPNPELEIEKADMQRRVLEGRVRGEIDAAKADAEIGLKEAQAMQIMAELQQLGKPDASDQMKMVMESMKAQREDVKGKLDIFMKQMDLVLKQMDLELADKKIEEAKQKAKEKKEKDASSSKKSD